MKLALICGAAKMSIRQEYFEHIGVTKAGTLDLLLKEIASLCTEAIFSNQSAYYFEVILKKLWL